LSGWPLQSCIEGSLGLTHFEPLCSDLKLHSTGVAQLINIGKRVITNNIHGYLPSEIVFYLMNYHIHPRAIWLTLHGETDDIVQYELG